MLKVKCLHYVWLFFELAMALPSKGTHQGCLALMLQFIRSDQTLLTITFDLTE
jgi:uncharacterized membrane protein